MTKFMMPFILLLTLTGATGEWTALHQAAKKGDVAARDQKYGATTLHGAAVKGQVEEVGREQSATSGCSERPWHDPKLKVKWVRDHGRMAPYTCRTFADVREVNIDHIVAYAEARRSGLSCARAAEFVNDPLNITVAYPKVNRQKYDKDIADWRPARNVCWFATRVKKVKEKYDLVMDDRERQVLENVLKGCSCDERQSWRCQ